MEPFHKILVVINRQHREATARKERTANRMLPVGLGALTASVLDREFVDYERFTNRRQVASYTGLCPSEASSGKKRFLKNRGLIRMIDFPEGIGALMNLHSQMQFATKTKIIKSSHQCLQFLLLLLQPPPQRQLRYTEECAEQ